MLSGDRPTPITDRTSNSFDGPSILVSLDRSSARSLSSAAPLDDEPAGIASVRRELAHLGELYAELATEGSNAMVFAYHSAPSFSIGDESERCTLHTAWTSGIRRCRRHAPLCSTSAPSIMRNRFLVEDPNECLVER